VDNQLFIAGAPPPRKFDKKKESVWKQEEEKLCPRGSKHSMH